MKLNKLPVYYSKAHYFWLGLFRSHVTRLIKPKTDNTKKETISKTKHLTMLLLFRMLWSLLLTLAMKLFPPKSKIISGKVVLITGAAQGIGRQLAYKFASLGVKLALVDLNEKGMMETKGNVEKTGAICRIYRCDISKRDQVAKLGAEVREDFGVLDILVNNAGIVHVKNFLRLTDSEICQTIEVNLFGTIWMVREFLQDMSDRNDGHIVNISSMAGFYAYPLVVPYCVSKFGVKGFGEALTADLDRQGKTGIHISTVYPGAVDTPMISNLSDYVDIIMGGEKLLKPEFVADTVVEGVLKNKRHIYVPEALWRLEALINLLPVKTMKILYDSRMAGFYEK